MLIEIILPTLVFSGLVLLLAIMVMAARRQLEPSGLVRIEVNEQRSFEANAGSRLLQALAEQGIFLPAVCGGRGTCGQCRITVTSGAGPLLPTEEPHINAEDAAIGVRLACMLKLSQAIAVSVPASMLSVRRTLCTVESNRGIAPCIKELVLVPREPIDFEAGDYVLLEAPPHRLDFADFEIDSRYRPHWEENGFFRLTSRLRDPATRAYSLANPPRERGHLTLVVRIALPPPTAPAGTPPGQVSSFIFSLKTGDKVAVRGPFGNFHVRQSEREMVFIAGGAGIAPVRSMILEQLASGSRRRMSLWFGARTRHELCYEEEFAAAARQHENFDYQVALSSPGPDGSWRGQTGFIHAVVYERYLKQHPAPREIEFYVCGPPLMSAAVLQMLKRLGVPDENVSYDDFGA